MPERAVFLISGWMVSIFQLGMDTVHGFLVKSEMTQKDTPTFITEANSGQIHPWNLNYPQTPKIPYGSEFESVL